MSARHVVALAITLAASSGFASTTTLEAHPWDGSQAPPVHRFTLYDEDGSEIAPQVPQAMPISTKNSCGTCHTYATVSSGWHWNSSKNIADKGRPGEPWVLVDRRTGTQLPLSYRAWKGTYHPDAVGMRAWNFTREFGRHLPGGDMAEPSDETADPNARWALSGKVEINCFACHNQSPHQDPSEWARQIARENFRWAATAASGIGDVDGMASRIRETWAIPDGPNKDDSIFAVAPSVRYDVEQFDQKRRTVLDVTRRPSDKNCLQCHSVTSMGTDRWQQDGDVHSRAGIKCTDCHRNDLGHAIVRGYEGEKVSGKHVAGEFTCAGCHTTGESEGKAHETGRLGAPVATHGGLPPVHFEKLACTACHSGPLPSREATRVRTSRANRLGIYGRAHWFTDAPNIVEPVFMKDQTGKLAPFRMMWPAFWAKLDGDKATPLLPEKLQIAATGILDGEVMVLAMLDAITTASDVPGTAVYVANGKVFSRSPDGGLGQRDYDGTRTVTTDFWGKLGDEGYVPLVSDFDATQPPDGATALRILSLIEQLQPAVGGAPPVLVYGGKVFERTPDAELKVSDAKTSSSEFVWMHATQDGPKPLLSGTVIDALSKTVGTEESMTETQVAEVLQRLSGETSGSETKGQYAYISSGRMFRLGADGKLTAEDHPAAEPYAWPVAHNVRPAGQSLGTAACTDCHSRTSPFFVSQVRAAGPLLTKSAAVRALHEYAELDMSYEDFLSASFSMRPMLKTLLFIASAIVAIVLIPVTFLGFRRFARQFGPKE